MTDHELLKAYVRDIPWKEMTPEEIDRVIQMRVDAYEQRIAERGGQRPKREGYLIERLALMDNLWEADADAQLNKTKTNRSIRRHNQRRIQDLRALQLMILTNEFPPARYTPMWRKTDAGKTREIAKQSYHPWRILHHDIMIVTGGTLNASLINDTFACIKGKGLHFGVKRVKKFMRLNPECRWFWKTDFKKYYQSIPHDIIRAGLEKKFKDPAFIELVETALFSYECTEEIHQALEDERQKKKRRANWCLYKPTSRQFRAQQHRPPHEGEATHEGLLQIQRRCRRIREDERRSTQTTARVHSTDGESGIGRQDERDSGTNRKQPAR